MKVTKSLFSLRLALFICASIFASTANGQNYTTLYTFKDLGDGANPMGGLIFGSNGALYGTGAGGGDFNSCDEGGACGVVFTLAPPAERGAAWTENALYDFQFQDPFPPNSNLVFDKSGNLYGSTGGPDTSIYQLTEVSGVWSLNPAYASGKYGIVATPILDARSDLYTTVEFTSSNADGAVIELTPQSNGTWSQKTLYAFLGGTDGNGPAGGVIADREGNLYGTTLGGGGSAECGTVFELSPHSNGTWTESVLYSFTGSDGCNPYAGLIFDRSGNLYGTTYVGGLAPCTNGCGVVFKLTPPGTEGAAWTESVLHRFANKDGANPYAGLAIDSSGALYGTTVRGGSGPCEPTGAGCGTVFRLAPPSKSGGNWTLASYSFQGQDGFLPYGNVLLDESNRVLYGTTSAGGRYGYGVVFQIAQ